VRFAKPNVCFLEKRLIPTPGKNNASLRQVFLVKLAAKCSDEKLAACDFPVFQSHHGPFNIHEFRGVNKTHVDAPGDEDAGDNGR